jgi:hypothetical protein
MDRVQRYDYVMYTKSYCKFLRKGKSDLDTVSILDTSFCYCWRLYLIQFRHLSLELLTKTSIHAIAAVFNNFRAF